MTKDEAIAIYNSGQWKAWRPEEKVNRQLYEDLLMMPFAEFHTAVEEVFGRPVYTHEFTNPEKLKAEFEGKIPAVALKESIEDFAKLMRR